MSVRALFALVCLLGLFVVAPARAQSVGCGFTSAAPALAFGDVAANPTPQRDTASQVRVECSTTWFAPVTVKLCLKLGNGSPDTSLFPRRMANGAARMNYQVTRDSARSLVWGDDSGAESVGLIVELTRVGGFTYRGQAVADMFGRIASGQTGLTAGNYASTMTLQMTGSFNTSAPCSAITQFITQQTVQATARATSSCTLVANPLNFGTVNVLTANIDATTSLGLNCTNGAPWTIRMNGGTVTGNVAARRMGVGGAGPGVIDYQLRHGSPTGALWGDGTAGTTVLTGTGTGTSQTVAVYGRVPGGQPPPPVGTYSDVVTVSVEY